MGEIEEEGKKRMRKKKFFYSQHNKLSHTNGRATLSLREGGNNTK